MSFRHAAFIAVLVLPLLLLTACDPAAPGPAPTHSTTGTTPASSSPQPATQDLPADALLGMTGTVTAENGAILALSLVVHSSLAASDSHAAARVSALTEKCSGELDGALLTGGSYGILQVNYTATLVGSIPWPSDLPLLMLPTAKGISLTSTEAVTQIAVLPAPFEAGDYVPHCAQFAFLSGPGTGATYLAFAGDATGATPFVRWADFPYGFTINSPAGFVGSTAFGGLNPARVAFSGCMATVTALGSAQGSPSSSWSQEFATDHCAVGGSAQSLGGK